MKKILIETEGNIFEASLKIFDSMIADIHEQPKINLYKNIMQELKKNNINLFHTIEENIEMEEINQFVDLSILNIEEKKEFKYIMKIISTVKRTASINACSGNMSVEEARNELEEQIRILKRGMAKSEVKTFN